MIDIGFDEANLVADAGLVQVIALAEAVGLVTERAKIMGRGTRPPRTLARR